MIQTVFFDMDGTLIDTEAAAAKAIRDAFDEWKIKVTDQDAHFITGRTWDMAFQYLFSKYKVPMPNEEAARHLLERYRDQMQNELIEVPGAVRAVKDLARDFPLALVSGSHRADIEWALKKLGIRSHFKVVLGAEDYPRSKPAPDGFKTALKLLNANPSTTLVFEDSQAGVQSGIDAGLHVCVITSTNHFGVDTSKGHFFIPDLTGVTSDWIKSLQLKRTSG